MALLPFWMTNSLDVGYGAEEHLVERSRNEGDIVSYRCEDRQYYLRNTPAVIYLA